MTIHIETIEDMRGLQGLSSIWDDLLDKSSSYTPFMSFDWISRWWKWFGGKRRFFILVGRRDGEVLGIAPFMLSERGIGIRRLEFLIDDMGSRFDFIVERESSKEFFDALSRYLERETAQWDELLLNYFPCASCHYDTAREMFLKRGFKVGEHFFYSPVIRIGETWKGFLEKKSKKFRGSLRSYINKVQREGIVSRMVTPREDLEAVSEGIFDIERKSWKERAGTSITASKPSMEFYKDIIRTFGKNGHLYLGVMEKEGKPIAYDFNLAKGEKVFSLKMGYDEGYRNLGIGKVLFAFTVQQSFEDGYRYHELMGVDEGFKREWTDEMRKHSRFHVYHSSLKSRVLYFYNFIAKKAVKRTLNTAFGDKDRLPLQTGKD